MSSTPGADQLQALITFSNQTTGGSDTKISDAVATLASGYGGGGGSGEWTTDGLAQRAEPNGAITITASDIVKYAFQYNTAITSVHAPNSGNSSGYAFNECTGITKAVIKTSGINEFQKCTALTHVDYNGTTQVVNYSFYNCSSLTTIVIRSVIYVSLQNYNAVSGTPFENKDAGTVLYVPSNLISTYQGGAWGNCAETITAIEGSQYENYYVDGTAIS